MFELTSPPTVKRVSSVFDCPFQEADDFMNDGDLLLAATINTVVDNMDETTVTRELSRSQTTTVGSLEEKRKRLQNKMCMAIGELSSQAAVNKSMLNGLNFSRCDSDGDNKIKEDIETLTNAQKCIENTLKHVVESIVHIKSAVNTVQSTVENNHAASAQLPGSHEPSCNYDVSELTKEMRDCRQQLALLNGKKGDITSSLNKCNEELKNLTDGIERSGQELKSVQSDLNKLQKNAVNVLKKTSEDMGSFYNSTFSDESRAQISELYDYIMNHSWYDVGEEDRKQLNDNTEAERNDRRTYATVVSEEQATGQHAEQTTGFRFPEPINPSLNVLIASDKKVKSWLITDSIMRHINEFSLKFRKYRLCFQRIDRTGSKALLGSNLIQKIGREKPHLITIHLGINDIQKGSDSNEIVDNFKAFLERVSVSSPSTKLIISLPLLTGQSHHDRQVVALRRLLSRWVRKVNDEDQPIDIMHTRIFLQSNFQLLSSDDDSNCTQNTRYFNPEDPLHLSTKGKQSITCALRSTIEKIFKDINPPDPFCYHDGNY